MKTNSIGSIEEYIEQNGYIVQTASGNSMFPLLRNRKDEVVIDKVSRPLKKYDVPLYKAEKGSGYILHRIIKIKDGKYVIRGDNTYKKELWVTDNHIVGVLSGFYRNGKYHSVEDKGYKFYVKMNMLFYPFRLVYFKCKRALRWIVLKIIRKDK